MPPANKKKQKGNNNKRIKDVEILFGKDASTCPCVSISYFLVFLALGMNIEGPHVVGKKNFKTGLYIVDCYCHQEAMLLYSILKQPNLSLHIQKK